MADFLLFICIFLFINVWNMGKNVIFADMKKFNY